MNPLSEQAGPKAGVKRLWRLAVVALVALVSFGAALHSFRAAPVKACLATATHDPAYQAHFVEPPSVNSNVYHLDVTHDGKPISGARVCFDTSMRGMSGMANSQTARETSPGRYEVMIRFQMSGGWNAHIGVVESGKAPVMIPVSLTIG